MKLPADKRLHDRIAMAIFLVTAGALRIFADIPGWDILIGVFAGALAGGLKELWDLVSGKGTPELADFHASLYGVSKGFIAWVLVEIVVIIIKSFN